MTLTQMQTFVRTLTNLETNLVAQTQLTDLLNQGAEDFQADTEILDTESTQDIDTGTSTYDFPNDYLRLLRVEFDDTGDGDYQQLPEVTRTDLDIIDATWRSTKGTPTQYYVDAGNSRVRIYPEPDAAFTDGLRFVYIQQPNTLSGSSDVSTIPDAYHRAICFYAVAHSYYRDNEVEQGDRYMQMYNRKRKECKMKQNHPSEARRVIQKGHSTGFSAGQLANLGTGYPIIGDGA